MGRRVRHHVTAVISMIAAAVLLTPTVVGATTGSNALDLNGGDKLVSDAFHCGTFFNHCSWQTSAKLIGSNPKRASWIQNNAIIEAHGPSAKITLGKSINVEVTFKSKTMIKTRWRNTKSWISSSKGKVSPSKTTLWIGTKSSAYASHPKFGRPGPVVAYAGAL
jgi:hypothetical protein